MELKKTGRSWFGATQYVLTLWGLGKKTAAILALIATFIPFLNLLVIIVAFVVCGLNTRTWLYEKTDWSDEKKDGINEFITKMGQLIMVLFIIGVVVFVIALATGMLGFLTALNGMNNGTMVDPSMMTP